MEYCPLSGQPCPEKKCISSTDIVKNKAVNTNKFCNQCGMPYVESLIQTKQDVPTTDPVVITNAIELIDILLNQGIKVEQPMEKPPCPHCNLSIYEFNSTGKFGCSFCYTHFEDVFLSLAGPFQENENKHVGKHVKKIKEVRENKYEALKVLKLKLAQAKELEKYEEAAKIWQQIKDLEN